MGRIVTRRPVTRVVVGEAPRRRPDALAVEEPLEIRVGGEVFAVTMRTPGHDVELATGFLLSEGILRRADDIAAAIHCGGPGTGGEGNTYNVLDVTLAADAPRPAEGAARRTYTTSSCGVCGTASIEAVRTASPFDVAGDASRVSAAAIAQMPPVLRGAQAAFDKTGGIHAAALFDVASGEMVALREDVGRHNAVDKVLGWAAMNGCLPLGGHALMVSGRVAFEIVQKAFVAGVPIVAAVSAPTSLAVELAEEAGMTLVGFVRGDTMNVYAGAHRVA
ncbi:formate dehydrogenase accessory sulfurtransferase FdhD [Microbacterium excoecariae]|uniref:formate dehydrogenase accessory sulfurtransferase FdhD n=1 Tax=Microbacterium excoecariae TaxID=2715210 RepID=UPI0014094C28|nr:formate dehydrogenase accessory sulfurtransferase FdhD [Microbacterium excoecariae]NHI16994.1 formate dehydrogenase accessory sulfurtransferase FdhD [Microbacterium excoecariae]